MGQKIRGVGNNPTVIVSVENTMNSNRLNPAL